MTVGELIVKLQELPPDDRVLVNGYEGGYSELTSIHKQEVMKRNYETFYMGEFEDYDTWDGEREHFPAWIIPR